MALDKLSSWGLQPSRLRFSLIGFLLGFAAESPGILLNRMGISFPATICSQVTWDSPSPVGDIFVHWEFAAQSPGIFLN